MHANISGSDLLSSSHQFTTSDDPYVDSNDRTRLLAGTEVLEDGSRRLLDSQRIALETEAQGPDILRNLRGQREQIENSRDTVRRLCPSEILTGVHCMM
jgi:vesicle transport through interaction with t-SNAREs protein 1